MKVFLLLKQNTAHETEILGIYSERSLAEKAEIKTKETDKYITDHDYFEIEEWEVKEA